MSETPPLRIGTLGAASITSTALLRPAAKLAGAEVLAVAARDPERARRFAGKHGIPFKCAGFAPMSCRVCASLSRVWG